MMRNTMTAPPLQGISNLMKMQGRMGDTELVHMSPMEVKGLASLGRLTRNPETGLPEAFSIGGFFRDVVGPIGAGIIFGPAGAVGYSMANTAAKGGDFGDVALAGLTSYAGSKLGSQIGAQFAGDATGAGAEAGATAASEAAKSVPMAARVGPQFGTTIMGEPLSSGLMGATDIARVAAANIPEQAAKGLGSSFGDTLQSGISGLVDKGLETLTNPEKLGGAIGRTLGSQYADAALELQQQGIPEQVKEAEQTQSNFSTGNLQNLNPQYADRGLTASQIVGAMQGTRAPLQFTDPSYSPAVTGNLSGILGAKNGGGLEDALESITEGAEKIADMEGGQVYFEGMVKGDGDGMSDEIPFSIENKQPALLSRDEYVLPADVVSALGNGSSNAGADMLDKFMTDVREKSMGRERQINQIG